MASYKHYGGGHSLLKVSIMIRNDDNDGAH